MISRIGETRLEGDEATLTRRAAELGVRAVYQELSLVEGLTVARTSALVNGLAATA